LTKQQKALAEAFTKPTTAGDGKIGGIAFKPAPVTGAPLRVVSGQVLFHAPGRALIAELTAPTPSRRLGRWWWRARPT
jgi:hypothetical protein